MVVKFFSCADLGKNFKSNVMKKNSSYNEMVRVENEITKMKLQAEFGCQFSDEKKDLNPEIERMWLNNILEFERASVANVKITVAEKIGNPKCRTAAELNDEEIICEVQVLMELMRKNNIVLDTIDNVEDRKIYRFITEELFKEEMFAVTIPNMYTFYIYEEFHPNHESDIRDRMQDFMKLLVIKDDQFIEDFFLCDKENEVVEIQINNLKRKLSLFRKAYDEMALDHFNITSLKINEGDKAEAEFEFQITVLPPGSKTFQILSGPGKFVLVNYFRTWVIEGMEMEGVIMV
jgi:hypothetical protein